MVKEAIQQIKAAEEQAAQSIAASEKKAQEIIDQAKIQAQNIMLESEKKTQTEIQVLLKTAGDQAGQETAVLQQQLQRQKNELLEKSRQKQEAAVKMVMQKLTGVAV
ncbi:MAG: hypothetical protein HZA78_12360 [Candidatus Schekmanbacteria bacterium]|nr:hypothetical protein [Candidatus Schekmanbacteria bacterium]